MFGQLTTELISDSLKRSNFYAISHLESIFKDMSFWNKTLDMFLLGFTTNYFYTLSCSYCDKS